MELDITSIFTSDTWDLSGSKATHGDNAGPNTWAAAKARAANPESADEPLLKSEDDLQHFRDYMGGYGAWDDDERAAWDATDCNALLLQLIAGDMRESGLDDIELDDEAAWAEYREGVEAGRYSGNIFRGDIPGNAGFGRVFYTLSN